MLIRLVYSILLVIETSFFLFPFEFTFLPGINTKMALAVCGLCMFGYNHLKGHNPHIKGNEVELIVVASLVSIVALFSAIYNNTHDLTYVSYVISMLVWVFGAFAVIESIRIVHSRVDLTLASNYLIAVCVIQCFLALVIDSSPAFKAIVDRYVAGMGFVDMDRLEDADRLYGIGCSLDVAGTRFAAILIIISQLLLDKNCSNNRKILYIMAFLVVVVVGDMISRTTVIGAAIAISLIIISRRKDGKKSTLSLFLSFGAVAFLISSALYRTSPIFHENIRFAFEGFFSLVEKGHWETNSNNILKDMIVFPESMKTWIIGDGYLLRPYDYDPHYVGKQYDGFYMDTDIGYLRFIFYFGVVGLAVFSYFFIVVCRQLVSRFPSYKMMFLLILMLNFIIWFKVSTDIFLIMAFYLCVPKEEPEQLASV